MKITYLLNYIKNDLELYEKTGSGIIIYHSQ